MKRVHLLAVFCFCVLSACSTKYTAMTNDRFLEINNGTTVAVIEQEYGTPTAVHQKGSDYVYEYVTQDYLGAESVRQIRYFFVVRDGKVYGKYQTFSNRPALELLQGVNVEENPSIN